MEGMLVLSIEPNPPSTGLSHLGKHVIFQKKSKFTKYKCNHIDKTINEKLKQKKMKSLTKWV